MNGQIVLCMECYPPICGNRLSYYRIELTECVYGRRKTKNKKQQSRLLRTTILLNIRQVQVCRCGKA